MQVYSYDECQSPSGNNSMVLYEIVTNVTTGMERSWVGPSNFFPFLVCKADFPVAPHKLCSVQSCHYKKGGTQHPTDNIHPFPAGLIPEGKGVAVVMSSWQWQTLWVQVQLSGLFKVPAAARARGWALRLVCTAKWCAGADLWTLSPLMCTFPFFLDSWMQWVLILKHARGPCKVGS